MRKLVILDCRELNDRVSAHSYLKEIMGFPEYYGRNLDALQDCLTEMQGCDVILRFWKESCVAGSYAARIAEEFEEAANANPRLKIYRE